MKYWISLMVSSSMLLVGCQSTPKDMDHGIKLNLEANKEILMNLVREGLKDPDSLKNFKIVSEYKCWLTGNLYSYVTGSASWCYLATYQAKNSYGGYVRGTSNFYFSQDNGVIHKSYNTSIDGMVSDEFVMYKGESKLINTY
ncbi:hypothetical protein HJ037_19425 [Vibrio parahaemolyticus]|uniref:hypothetical protein n=1 Tax=Vibrio alginolyticus TaxID=663 RepID=UPI001BD6DE37|nr:hypothetical protein [Vibrio alginolyticus]MBE5122665.1 hypothetical protein [Vibrio parahaemolyticus]MBS9811594.1 hypothetical protein [Vibrio alginolyticus]HCH1701669.1 hypothetical protein [Vibrio parahaemolyticus]